MEGLRAPPSSFIELLLGSSVQLLCRLIRNLKIFFRRLPGLDDGLRGRRPLPPAIHSTPPACLVSTSPDLAPHRLSGPGPGLPLAAELCQVPSPLPCRNG